MRYLLLCFLVNTTSYRYSECLQPELVQKDVLVTFQGKQVLRVTTKKTLTWPKGDCSRIIAILTFERSHCKQEGRSLVVDH